VTPQADRDGPEAPPVGRVRDLVARGVAATRTGLRDPTSPLVASQLLTAGVAFLANILASRALAPSGRGELALLLQIGYLSSLVMILGTDRSVLAVYPGAPPRVVTRAFLRLLLWPTVLGLLAAVALALLPLPGLGSWQLRLAVASIFAVVNSLVRAARSIAIATGQMRAFLHCTVINQVLLLVFVSALWVAHNSSSAVWVAAYALSDIIPTGAYLLIWARSTMAGRTPEPQVPDHRRQAARSEGILLFPAAVATSGMLRLDRLLLPVMASTAALGVYAGIGTMTEVVTWPLLAFADARLGRWRQANDEGRLRIRPPLLATIGYSVGAGAFFTVVIRVLAVPLLGPAYVAADDLVAPLVLAAMVYGLSQVMVAMLTARRRNANASIAETTGFVISVIAYLLLIPRYGAMGAAYASLIGYGSSFAVAGMALIFAPARRPAPEVAGVG
jgi:O-antigen/teichoic acid export membrane protein